VRINSERTPALPPEVLAQFAQACLSISDAAADERGFVAIRHLLARFQAKLIARPLLVEGMIASQRIGGSSDDCRWLVLVDSDKYKFSDQAIDREYSENALPERLRFTIAHELAHSLAFRVSDFGIQLHGLNKEVTPQVLLNAIEDETDWLSSLLLVPQRALATVFKGRREPPSASELAQARQTLGISRPVLVNRLRLLSSIDPDGLKNGFGFKNLAVGIAEWTAEGNAVLRKWPIFVNFDRNVIPEFLLNLAQQDRLPANSVFNEPTFSLCGGNKACVELTVHGGTPSSPRAERLDIKCSVEGSNAMAGSRAIYVVAATFRQ